MTEFLHILNPVRLRRLWYFLKWRRIFKQNLIRKIRYSSPSLVFFVLYCSVTYCLEQFKPPVACLHRRNEYSFFACFEIVVVHIGQQITCLKYLLVLMYLWAFYSQFPIYASKLGSDTHRASVSSEQLLIIDFGYWIKRK